MTRGHALLETVSIEITARDREVRAAVLARLPRGSEVFVADLPDQPPDVVLEASVDLRRGGLEPVPHLVARNIAGVRVLDGLLGSLATHAGVRHVFVTGGDRDEPTGTFASALELIRSGLLDRHGIRRLGFAGYPEGHPKIPGSDLDAALRQKIGLARERGFETLIISQFAFAAAPVADLARRLRAEGIATPIRVGTAGPAERGKLAEFGRDLGVGRSAEEVETGRPEDAVTPSGFLADLAGIQSDEPELGLEGIHLFPFGTIDACLDWLEARRAASA